MSGASLIELLAARLAGRGARRAAPALREALADVSSRGIASEPNPMMLRVSDLPERGVDAAKVREYGNMLSMSEPPPILVARRPGGSWEIMDGEHRAAAMRQAGRQEVPAIDISERVGWGAAQEAPQTAPSLRGALAEVNANRAPPDAGGGQGEFDALRRELRDHGFAVPQTMPNLPQLEVKMSELRAGQIGSLDRADAARYAAMTTEAPPILVRRQGNGWHIIDGNRRVAAARLRGDGSVRAVDASDLFRTQPDDGARAAAFDESTTWYRGGRPGSGRTFLTRDRAMAERFAKDLHGNEEITAGNVAVGRQMVVDWNGRPWDAGPSGWSTDHMAEVARREGYDSVLLQNVESVRGSPSDELVLLNENQFRTAPDGGPVQAGRDAYQAQLRSDGFDVDRPLYHGTGADFESFDAARGGQNFGGRDARLGVSLTPEPWNASDYAMDTAHRGGAPNVRPVFARGRFKEVNERELAAMAGEEISQLEAMARFAERARAEGYDGIAVHGVARGQPTVEYKVFPDADGGFSNIRPRFGENPTRTAPNAGSDRNALQRALRERMERE